jgi:hypothetical protein
MVFDFTNPYGMVGSQPNIGPITPQPQQTPNPMGGGKNDKLALMLYALGGALKGDKNFMQNTMQLQQMQEGKKRKKEMEENWNQALGKLEGSIDPTLLELAKIVGAEKGTGLIASGLPKATKGPTSWEEYLRASKDPAYRKYLEEQEEAGATKIDFADKGWAALGPKKYEERLNLATSAQSSNINLSNLENIIDKGLQTGFGAELGLSLNRIGQAIVGPDFKAGDIAGAESFAAGATQLILPEVKKLGVNPTDKDLDFVVKGSPELSKSVEGNKLMLKALKLSNARAIDAHNFDNAFYTNPVNAGKTEIDRNVAFQIHMANNPELYSAQPLIQEYNSLLEREAMNKIQSGDIINVDPGVPLPEGM